MISETKFYFQFLETSFIVKGKAMYGSTKIFVIKNDVIGSACNYYLMI